MLGYGGIEFIYGIGLSCKFEINDFDFKICYIIVMVSINMYVYYIYIYGIYIKLGENYIIK